MYELVYTDQDLSPVDAILQIPSKDVEICIRKGHKLMGYQLLNFKWEKKWEELIFQKKGEYPLENYPWTISEKLLPDRNVLIIQHPDGIRFYQINSDKSGLTFIAEDGNFHEVYDLTVRFGHFYPDKNCIGVISRSRRGEVKFYGAMKDSFEEDVLDPLFLLDRDLKLSPEWYKNTTQLLVTKLYGDDREVIGLRTETGLEFFEFNDDYELQSVVRTDFKINNDGLFFANLTGSKYQDILVLNEKNLNVYSYDGNYALRSSSDEFLRNGWSSDFTKSVIFVDVNQDGRDDFIFTGSEGLRAFMFDLGTNRWEKLTNSQKLSYGKVVGTLPPILPNLKQPSLFIEDSKGNLRWSSDTYTQIRTNVASTATAITTTTPIPTPNYSRKLSRVNEIERKEFITNLRWAEQLDSNFLKQSVNTRNGHVGLNIPLVDASSSSGLKIQINLSYSSQSQITEILGVGWYIPIAQDYIFVDYQGSVFPNDATYYILMQGSLYRLKFKSKNYDVHIYQVADDDIQTDIEYHRSKELWIVRGRSEDVTFGKSNDPKGRDAIAYGLTWPHWRFSGIDKANLKKIVTTWYLNRRYDRARDASLYYNYEREDGNIAGYTLGFRLKTITDGFYTHVNFSYASKNQYEYTIRTVDSNGKINLPLPQTHTKYLEECKIDTLNSQQILKFQYEIKNNKRLLSGIDQILPTGSESVFKFDYQYEVEKFMLTSCKLLPQQLNSDYEYDFYVKPTPAAIFDNVITYFHVDSPKIGYGSDYSVLGSIKGDEIELNILNRSLTHVIQKLAGLKVIGIKDYAIQAYDDVLFVVINTEQRKLLYVFNREGRKWSDKPVSFIFQQNDKFYFSRNVISFARDSSSEISLYSREENNSSWKLTIFSMARSVVYLTNYQKIVAAYDNEDLILFYLDEQWNWSKKLLGKFYGFQSDVINRFDLKQEMKNNLMASLRNSALQAFGNFLMLNDLKERHGLLYFDVRLFLLNEDYNIGISRRIIIDRENIYHLKHELQSEDKKISYEIGYVYENGMFRIKVQNVSGEDIDKIKNKNIRYDTVEEMKKNLNDDRDFQNSMRENAFLLDWSKYQVQMTQEGVQIGDVMLRLTGSGWEKTSNPTTINLGDHFKLESKNDGKQFRLTMNNRVVKEMNLFEANQIVNRYPSYIAYQSGKDSICLITFKDDSTLGDEYVFFGEKFLSSECDRDNFVTVFYDELRIRPVSTLQPTVKELYVKKMTLINEEVRRATGYKHSVHIDKENKTISEIISVIPGDDEKSHGRYESLETFDGETKKKSERWFDSNNKEIFKPEDEVPEVSQPDQETDSLLLDRTNKLVISDFSPYNLKDEMCGYYGFESYEKSSQFWNFDKSRVKSKFAFTGLNYLEIIGSNSTFEGRFKPADQEITYLASCWIRSQSPLILNTPVSYLKVLVNTEDGNEFIGLNSQVKLRWNDWYYLELPIDFQILKQIYLNEKGISAEYFRITLRVEGERLDLDHVRFTPFTLDFQATVYRNEKSVAVLQSNGLVTRTVYNRRNEEIALIQENNVLTRLISRNKIGDSKNLPAVLTFEPENGLYESFSSTSFQNNWESNDKNAWKIAPGQLWHNEGKHAIKSAPYLLDREAAVRFYYDLHPKSSVTVSWEGNDTMEMVRQGDFMSLKIPNESTIKSLPSQGEIIVMGEENYLWVWINGLLFFDQPLAKSLLWDFLQLEFQGKVLVEDLIIMNRPKLKIEYYNSFNEKIQTLEMENASTVRVSEILYDEVGREAVTTKTSSVQRNITLLHYRSDFVLNKDTNDADSVFKTGIIKGLVRDLNPEDKGYPYSRTEFALNPLGEVRAVGLPGEEFSVSGPYSAKFSTYSDISFIDLLFPKKQNYRQKVEYTSSGTIKVSVFDKFDLEVARYVKVPSFDHLLSTYEYDKEGNLIKILPPTYHEEADTYRMLKPWSERNISLELEQNYGTFFTYDKNRNLVKKITPDDGVTEYLYNSIGLLRFMVSLGRTNRTDRVIYYNYDESGQLVSTGSFDRLLPTDIFREIVESDSLPYTQVHQEFSYSDDSRNPLLRGRIKHFITYNDDIVIEKLKYDAYDQVVEKTSTISSEDEIGLKIERINGRVKSMTYPIRIHNRLFVLTHTYNKLGQLVGLGSLDDPHRYVTFTYRPTGELSSESYERNYTRKYFYNSPGFLKQILDPFLTENIEYTDLGYGQKGFGDGMIMRTVFKPHWSENADDRWFQIRQNEPCLRALMESGYLNSRKKPLKLFNLDLAEPIPLICNEKSIATVIAQNLIPKYYGHSYTYGNHQELTKAKYFTSDTEQFIEPLKYDSFSKIAGLSKEQSKDIWESLAKNGFIIIDQTSGIGKRGKSFFRSTLLSDLKLLNNNYVLYARPIEKLIMKAVSEGKTVTVKDFEEVFLKWHGIKQSSLLYYYYFKKISKEISQMLLTKNYIQSDVLNLLDSKFKDLISKYGNHTVDILTVLHRHFAHQLGESPFDVESYNIDPNGNHKLFYTGYDRYEFTYKNYTNQISVIKKYDSTFKMEYDEQGNVIKATHKGINRIDYYAASQRPSLILLQDGRTLRFSYDAQGERILKRVFDADGKLISEVRYHRDEQGRVLVDRKISEKEDVVTVYLYGPRGLLGFIRNDKFYNVMTDHAGSVRLVVQDGRVVAAYDYLPYGQIMRTYGYDPKAHITYRYTGQEWDEETGLYNYHARLYDPAIGRFYQIDPKSQYFSPYVYSGNSPLSVIDPDGEFAWLLIAIIGLYLGGAAANNRWNPVEWDWKDSGTYLGMFGGAVAGGLMPIGAAASISAIGLVPTLALGAGGAYLTTAAANQNFDPSKWLWDRPETWNSLFQGFGTGSGIAGGIGITHKFAKDIANCVKMCTFLTKISASLGISTKAMKTIFLTVSYGTGGGLAIAHGVIANDGKWEWDFTNPSTWLSLIDGFDMGIGLTQNFVEIARGIGKLSKNHKAIKDLLKSDPSKRAILKGILKNKKHPLVTTAASILLGYFMSASASGELDITKWSLSSLSTYEGILNGVFLCKDTQNMLKYILMSKTKNPFKINKTKIRKWTERFVNLIDNVQNARRHFMYERLISDLFSDPRKIKDLNSPETETFLKSGYEKWKDGSSKPPKKLKEFFLKEINRKIDESSGEIKKWREEAEELIKEKNEIYPDRDIEFLNCRKARRRKRGTTARCAIQVSNEDSTEEKQLVEHFFSYNDEGVERIKPDQYVPVKPSHDGIISDEKEMHIFDRKSPQGWAENLSLLVESIPNTHAGTEPNFFINYILGSLLTLRNIKQDRLALVGSQNAFIKHYETKYVVPKIRMREVSGIDTVESAPILKTAFLAKDSNGKNIVVLKTFITEPRISKNKDKMKMVNDQLDIKSKFNKEELNDLRNKFHIKETDFMVEENIFYIKRDNSLEVKKQKTKNAEDYVKDHLQNVDNYVRELSSKSICARCNSKNFFDEFVKELKLFPDGVDINSIKDEDIVQELIKVESEFNEIPKIKDIDLDSYLKDIQKNDENTIKQAVDGLLNSLSEIYESNRALFKLQPEKESDFHGFVAGVLTWNFKHMYGLDVRVEAIAGRGNADLMFIIRRGSNGFVNWEAIPIIIEFKSKKTSPEAAKNQILYTGYLYNLGLKTLARKALIVGFNVNLKGIKSAIELVDIPKSEGFVNQLIANRSDLREVIIRELKHLYYSISPYAIKTPKGKSDNYVSKLILAQLLSRNNLEVHVNDYKNTEVHGKLTTCVFKENGQWVMLNIVEGASGQDRFLSGKEEMSKHIKLPDNIEIDTSRLLRIDIKTNSRSEHGWSKQESPKSEAEINKLHDRDFFFQDVAVITEHDATINKDASYITLDSINVDKAYLEHNSTPVNVRKILDALSERLQKFPGFIQSESDFQAIVQGIFMNQKFEGGIVKVLLEANPSKEGRIDITLIEIKTDPGKISERERVIFMELKYKHESDSVESLMKAARKELGGYNNNLEVLMDTSDYQGLAIVYDPDTGIYYDMFRLDYPQTSVRPSSVRGRDQISDSGGSFDLIHEIPDPKRIKPESRNKRSVDITENDISYENGQNYDSSASVERTSPWTTSLWGGLQQFVDGLIWNQNPSEPNNNFTATEYTAGHFQGFLQLIDLWVRKFTGQKYPPQIITKNITLAEASVKAGELTEEFFKKVNKALSDLQIDLPIVQNLDDFILTRKISQKLISGELHDIPKILQSKIAIIYKEVANSFGVRKGNHFLENINILFPLNKIDADSGINQYDSTDNFFYSEPITSPIGNNVSVRENYQNNTLLGHRITLKLP